MAKGLGGVTECDVVVEEVWLGAGVFGGWDVEGLKGSQLLWV